MSNLIIVGAGGFGREVFCWLTQDLQNRTIFFDESPKSELILNRKVISDLSNYKDRNNFITYAIGDPKTRFNLTQKLNPLGLNQTAIAHKSVITGVDVYLDQGTIICPNSILTTNISLGKYVIINLSVTIGHDCRIGDFVTISPGANISGNVKIGNFSYIGTNATIREGVTIGDHSIVGMGAVVVKDVSPNCVVVGNPAKPLIKE